MTAVLILLAGIAFIAWLYFRRRAQTGLPQGAVVYDDAGRQHLESPLVSHRFRLAGRPDYLIETADGIVPVELKSSACPRSGPYDAHVYQLMTYCVLIEDALGLRVPYGILQYGDLQRKIRYTPDEKRRVLQLAEEIRAARAGSVVHRDHNHAARCRGCGYRSVCGEALH
ncbi:MAG: CRISPR-associated protein Cas4 [Acidobacteriaceae bacterium]|nr:CRISPR-associated protein Cas4 [Acidobacteriaceae bacterium]